MVQVPAGAFRWSVSGATPESVIAIVGRCLAPAAGAMEAWAGGRQGARVEGLDDAGCRENLSDGSGICVLNVPADLAI